MNTNNNDKNSQNNSNTTIRNLNPKEIYGDPNTDIELKISNGGAGPTGIIRKLAEDYISSLKNPNFHISWYQNISNISLSLVIEKLVDLSLVYEPKEVKEAIDNNLINKNMNRIFNDHFILVGPKDNSLNITSKDSIESTFEKIYKYSEESNNKFTFLSRDDLSGTNTKERYIWSKINKTPYDLKWYLKYTVFPKEALIKADEEGLYTITDFGTWLATLNLIRNTQIYTRGGEIMLNPCLAIMQKDPSQIAVDFMNYLVSANAQNLIKEFGKETYSQPFYTCANQMDF